jgi:hypothetical protein
MFRTALMRAALILAMGLGVWCGPAWAGEGDEKTPLAEKKIAHWTLGWWWYEHPPCDYWSTHNEVYTNNFRSDFIFLFGSARHFYGEAYVKGPPVPAFPVNPSFQTAPGYPGKCGYEGRPEYPLRPYPPGYEGQPYHPYPPYLPAPPITKSW